MPPGTPGDKRRDERSQQAAPPPAGRGATTTAYTQTLNRRGLPPQATIIGSQAPASRTPPAPPPAAGLRPVLDPARPLARTRHLPGERQSRGGQFST